MNSLTRRRFHAFAGSLAAVSALGPLSASAAQPDPASRVPWGIAIDDEPFRNDPAYRAAVARRAGLVVPMNSLKWATLRWERETFNFAPADALVAFAEELSLPVHGHTLLWYGFNPPWLDAINSRRELVRELERHIDTVVGRYRGRIASWDVVNEVIAHNPQAAGRWRDGVWQRVIGPAQVELAFARAHRADPTARLFINDYDLEDDSPRTRARQDAMLAIVERLQRKNVPVHAVGLQAHLYAERAIGHDNLRRFIRALRALGVGITITELDVIDWKLPLDPAERDVLVAAKAGEFLETVFAETTPEFLATWGLSDRYSWIGDVFARTDAGKARPLPLDVDLRPKPLLATIETYARSGPG